MTKQMNQPQTKQQSRQDQPDWARQAEPKEPTRLALRFSPTAWAKLLFFRDKSEVEIGGFGITRLDDLLSVEDFVTVKQDVTVGSVSFEDEAVGDLFETQVDAGRKPEQFARIWLHSHPGDSARPSATDEDTFDRVFGRCDWAVMCILARNDSTYARLRFNIGPGGEMLIPVEVDYSLPFGASDNPSWEAEYRANIKASSWARLDAIGSPLLEGTGFTECDLPEKWLDELEGMDPADRQMIMEELAARPDLWGEESEVILG